MKITTCLNDESQGRNKMLIAPLPVTQHFERKQRNACSRVSIFENLSSHNPNSLHYPININPYETKQETKKKRLDFFICFRP